jgi:hypothetical protein
LLVLTANNRFFCLSYDAESNSVKTDSSISVAERAGRPADYCQTIVNDPQGTFIGLHAYNGLFRVVPLIKTSKRRKSSSTTKEPEAETRIDLERSYNIRQVFSLMELVGSTFADCRITTSTI